MRKEESNRLVYGFRDLNISESRSFLPNNLITRGGGMTIYSEQFNSNTCWNFYKVAKACNDSPYSVVTVSNVK